MSLVYPRIMYGWEVTASSNDKLDFKNAGVTYAATLNPGVYSAKGFEVEVQRAIRAIDTGHSVTCVFDHAAGTFAIGAGTAVFQLLFSTGANHATTCANLLGFAANADQTGATSYTSSVAGTVWTGGQIATNPQTSSLWDLAEPLQNNTPVTGQTAATAAKLLQREIRARQNKTDGGTLETVYIATFKKLDLWFNQLSASEQTNMESFLDWCVQGKVFSFLPDKTAGSAVLHLVLDNPSSISNAFSWTTRSEADYGRLTFVEQASA